MPGWSMGYRDLSAWYRAEEKRLAAKGILPGSTKMRALLYRNRRRGKGIKI